MNSVNGINSYNNTIKTTTTTVKTNVSSSSDSFTSYLKMDTVELSNPTEISEEERTERVNKLIAENEERINAFNSLISDMITKQGEKANFKLMGIDLTITDADIASAKDAISEDGDWGVSAVATRIMSMAEAFIGTDSSLFSTIKDAVYAGYADAENKWGGKLPDICQDTLSEIENRFDELETKLFGSEED